MASRDDDVRAFVAERDDAMRRGDIAWMRKATGASSDEVAEAAMHKARYEIPAMGRDLREASRRWLEERRLKRFGDLPFPPPGVLED